jgi:hypothetical protein
MRAKAMKTGRLLKFHRPAGDIQAYLFREQDVYRGVVYLLTAQADEAPVHVEEGSSLADVEDGIRAWVERHFPRTT